MATTPPMKKPTAMLLWNFRMIMVPPMLNASNIKADHTLVNPSENDLVPITAQDMRAKIPVMPRMEYLEGSTKHSKIQGTRTTTTKHQKRQQGNSPVERDRHLSTSKVRTTSQQLVVATNHRTWMRRALMYKWT